VLGLIVQGGPIPPFSLLLVVLTGLGGMAATYFWWMVADQSR
jgi:hypothetical protein